MLLPHAQQIRESSKSLLLIVDPDGTIGAALSEELSDTSTVVLVSKKKESTRPSMLFIPLTHLVPELPRGIYSHILFFFDEENKHLLSPLVEKAATDKVKLFIVATKETEHAARVEKEKLSRAVELLIVGDLFGRESGSPLDTFLQHVKKTKQIELTNMGLHMWHPVLFEDAISYIKMLLFTTQRKEPIFIGPEYGITSLSLSHGLQKIDPDIVIDFSSKEEAKEDSLASFSFAIKAYKGMDKIQEYYRSLVVHSAIKIPVSKKAIFIAPKKKKKNMGTGFLVYVVMVGIVLPFIMLFFSTAAEGLFLTSAFYDVKNMQWQSSLHKANAAEIFFFAAKSTEVITNGELNLVGGSELLMPLEKEIDFGNKLALSLREGVGIAKRVENVFFGKTVVPGDDVNQIIASEKYLSLLMQKIDPAMVPDRYKSFFENTKKLLSLASQVIDGLPQIIGMVQDKTYLVLFQNNMELRPGGGFIGSYGILTMSKGKIKAFHIHDVYTADGQLRGHIEPPFAIRPYIPIVHLYLRDSNFDVDFIKDAQSTSYLLSQETGIIADGVIGVDLTAVRGLLASVGSVYIPSLNQTVDKNNFFLLAESASEKNFFPGSSQKEDFLNSFFTALMQKVQSSGAINPEILTQELTNALLQKHVLVAFADPTVQEPFTFANLSSSLIDARAQSASALNDFLGINEANLGINKANAFVTRSVSQEVVIKESGEVDEKATLYLTNSSTGKWPGGPYKTYLRFILPQNAVLDSVTINNQKQTLVDAVTNPAVYEQKSFIPPDGLEIEKTSEEGKQLFGFLVTVPVQRLVSVAVSYHLSQVFPLSVLGETYSLKLFKQAGTDIYPYVLNVEIPSTLRVLSSSNALRKVGSIYTYNTVLATDTILSLSLSNK